jgi:hypothetical protein
MGRRSSGFSRFVVYSSPDGKISKDFDHRRVRAACLMCRKLKKRCDCLNPCSLCVEKGRTHLCKYDIQSPSSSSPPLEERRHQSNNKETLSWDPHKVPPVQRSQTSATGRPQQDIALSPYFEERGRWGLSNCVGPLSWHADATSVYRGSGVKKLLDEFYDLRDHQALECLRPWQNYERNVASVRSINHTFSPCNSHPCATQPPTQPFINPYECGIEYTMFLNLISIYWRDIHPIEPICSEPEFWTLFQKYSSNTINSTEDERSKVVHAFTIWVMLAYASRSISRESVIFNRLCQLLAQGNLMSSQSSLQRQIRFVSDPCEYFLYLAEECAPSIKLFQRLDSIDSLRALVLYVSYIHDGSERNWDAWTLLGMISNATKRLGLHLPRGPVANDRNSILFLIVNTLETSYAVDLGYQPASQDLLNFDLSSLLTIKDDTDNLQERYILARYNISVVLAKVGTIAFPLGGKAGSHIIDYLESNVQQFSNLETELEEIWPTLEAQLKLRESGPDSNVQPEIALRLGDSGPKDLFQKYVLDTMAHKARLLFYKPFLSCSTEQLAISEVKSMILSFQSKCIQSAVALLENQFAVANCELLFAPYRKFRWPHIFCHAFQAAVVLALRKEFRTDGNLHYQMIKSSSKLYRNIQSHAGCASAKAHLVLNHLLGEESTTSALSSGAAPLNTTEIDNSRVDRLGVPESHDYLTPLSPTEELCVQPGVIEFNSIPTDLESLEMEFFVSILGDLK